MSFYLLTNLISDWRFLVITLIFVFYKWSTSTFDYFTKRNVSFVKPYPFVGNMTGMLFKTEAIYVTIIKYCKQFKNESFFGFYEMRNPTVIINSPELIKQVAVKDADHFFNHRSILDEQDEPLFGNSLFALKDEKWKDMRTTLSPAFTGSKMRQMFQLIEECCGNTIEHLNKETASKKPLIIEISNFFTRFSMDVIASCAFGLKINSLLEKDNEFYTLGIKAAHFESLIVKIIFLINFRKLMKFLKIKLFEERFTQYFKGLVLNAMKYRAKHNIVRPDMIHLLMEARKGTLKEDNKDDNEGSATEKKYNTGLKAAHKRDWTDDDLVAQCFLFFLAGFETTSILLCFCAHELMENPDIQTKLQEEIDVVKNELNGKPLTYDVIQKMKYLDMVISETLRKWPPVVVLDRICTKPYNLVDPITNKKIHIPVGQTVWFPAAGIHHNSDYYPNPEKFDPERFNDENKQNIKPFTYIPFGAGIRNCIGSRFALMQAKAIIFNILSKFNLEVSPQTKLPLQLTSSAFQVTSKNGFWMQLRERS